MENEVPFPVLNWYRNKVNSKQLMQYLSTPTNYKTELADFVYNRLYERYIEPFSVLENLEKEHLDATFRKIAKNQGASDDLSNHKLRLGFSIMANMCLLIETLQSFRYGLIHSHEVSRELFNKFFKEEFVVKVFGETDISPASKRTNFYKNIRCGILHQGETTNGWKIDTSYTKALDVRECQINAILFLGLMRSVLAGYKVELINTDIDTVLWNNYLLKLHSIIQNCEKRVL